MSSPFSTLGFLGPWLQKLRAQGDITVTIDAVRLTGSAAVHRKYLRDVLRRRNEAFQLQLFKAALQPGMVVADVGAYLGHYTLLAARQVGAQGRVYAFEPDPRGYSYLRRNVEQNGFGDRVVAVNKAVTDRVGATAFYVDALDSRGSSAVYRRLWSRKIEVESLSLDAFFAAGPAPDIIKLDVEGGEVRVLEGMVQTIKAGHPGLILFAEHYPQGLHGAGTSGEQLLEHLRALGFDVWRINERSRQLDPVGARMGFLGVDNLYCVRR